METLTKRKMMLTKKIVHCLALVIAILFAGGLHAQNDLTLSLTTDCWGGETSWQITDTDGNVMQSVAGGTYGNQQTYDEAISLPDGCYNLSILDSYGDGMNGSQWGSCEVDGTYSLTDSEGNVILTLLAAGANFGNEETQAFSLGSADIGCTDPNATNYNSCATTDDGSCTYPVLTSSFSFDAGASCGTTTVQFTDNSIGNVTGWNWSFPGGDPSSSTEQNPSVTYNSPGTYTATLEVTDGVDTNSSSQDIEIASGIELQIVIVPDNYPGETSWDLVDEFGNLVAQGDVNGGSVCIDDNCHIFTIYDSYGDGICCGYGDGSFELLLDGVSIGTGGQFSDSQSINLNCPPGFDCNNAIVADEGEHVAPFSNAWYSFTPAINGQYRITTCDRAACDTKIWMYDNCNMSIFDDTNEATLTYNDDFCGVQAEVTPLLEGGFTYYLRIGATDAACAGEDVGFMIEYMGPVEGCTDPLACNYLPIAEVNTTCYYPGDIQCPSFGPDLEVLGDVFESSMYATTLQSNDQCYINEGCLQGFGERQILRFTTHIKNIGTEDYFIGTPGEQLDQFEFDDCHNHWHYEGYAEYVLYDGAGVEMPQIGFKNGFCVLDLECSDGGQAKYTCGNMGITAGCGDIYSSSLSCQWVDITDVPAGDYTLVVRTNWDQSPDANGSYELSYDNNWSAICISFDRDANGDIIDFTKTLDCPLAFDCLGVPFGNSQPDCAGNCPGVVTKGDVNNSGDIESGDASQYVQDILGGDAVVSPCTDMDADNLITVTDAALIAGCVFYGPDHVDELGVHDHCVWNDEVVNPNHLTTLSIGDVNTDQGYVDIHVLNPDNEIVGYEFTVSGLTIQSLENLVDPLDYDINPQSSLGGAKVIGLAYDDQVVPKNITPAPLVRIYYSAIEGTEVCIESIVDIVNEDYHNVLTDIGPCQAVGDEDFVDFVASSTLICQGESIDFTDLSDGTLTSWSWNFEGGTPSSSTDQNPTGIVFSTPGSYTITLTASGGGAIDSESKIEYIEVAAGVTYYLDSDNDGYGDEANSIISCSVEQGYSDQAGDCDDSNPDVYPNAPGTGEGIDNNCDGSVTGDEVFDCVADITEDGSIDVADLLMLLQEFGCTENCNPDVDLSGDGIISNPDMLIFLSWFGQDCPE